MSDQIINFIIKSRQCNMANLITKVILLIVLMPILITLTPGVASSDEFSATVPCTDEDKICVSSGIRQIDGHNVHRDCWEWRYSKTCDYQSKNDCKDYAHCYAVADLDCLHSDSLGNCVNRQKEFSCEHLEPVTIDKEMVRTALIASEGREQLLCQGTVPCIDGNCFDKSYEVNQEMMESISQLHAISQMKGVTDLNFALFAGNEQHCTRKMADYSNCCGLSLKGWGGALGAKCSSDDKDLAQKRQKNLCVFIGTKAHKTAGVKTHTKYRYCCFGSLFNKVFQVQARKQLGMSFGNADEPDCRGLTLQEIMRLDFEKIDFSEFFTEIAKQLKTPNIVDINSRVSSSLPNIKQYDGNPNNKQNKMSGLSEGVKDAS